MEVKRLVSTTSINQINVKASLIIQQINVFCKISFFCNMNSHIHNKSTRLQYEYPHS